MKSASHLTSIAAAASIVALSASVSPVWSEQLEVTADGVGIGTTTPGAALDVQSTKAAETDPDFLVESNLFRSQFRFTGNGGTGALNSVNFQYNATPTGLFAINIIESNGGFGFPAELSLDGAGNLTASGTVSGSSSRSVKDNFAAVDVQEVLVAVAELPIERWSYKAETDVAHIGPMAEDFHAAFAVGSDNKHISMVDSDGVALAAIQALHHNQQDKDRQVEALNAQLEAKNQQLEALTRRTEQQGEMLRALEARLNAIEHQSSTN